MELQRIVDMLSEQGAHYSKVMMMKLDLLKLREASKEEADLFLDEITDSKNMRPDKAALSYDILYLKALDYFNRKYEIEERIHSIDRIDKYNFNPEYLLLKAELLLKKYDRLQESIKVLEKAKDIENDSDIIAKLCRCYFFADELAKADELLKEYGCYLSRYSKLILQMDYYEVMGDAEQALLIADKIKEISGSTYNYTVYASYLLLQSGNYKKAKDICREALDKVNFNPMAKCEIVNYELASKLSNCEYKVNKPRLLAVYDSTDDLTTQAAIKVLLGGIDDAFKLIYKEIEIDMSQKYRIKRWPVFKQLHEDTRWIKLYS